MTFDLPLTIWKVTQGCIYPNTTRFVTNPYQLHELPSFDCWTVDFVQSTCILEQSVKVTQDHPDYHQQLNRLNTHSIQPHNDLDTAVAEAYGWPANLSTPEILHHLVTLNTRRHHEEQSGLIRWLRPEYQCKT